MANDPFTRPVPTLAQQTQYTADAVNASGREAGHRPACRPLADTGTRYYCIRQARTKIIGSRTMTLDEAGREAAVWRDEIGPAVVVVADDAARKAVRTEDQAALAALMEWKMK